MVVFIKSATDWFVGNRYLRHSSQSLEHRRHRGQVICYTVFFVVQLELNKNSLFCSWLLHVMLVVLIL